MLSSKDILQIADVLSRVFFFLVSRKIEGDSACRVVKKMTY